MRQLTIAFCCINFLLLSLQAFGQFGELPKGALFTGSMSTIKGEVGIFFPSHSIYEDNLKELSIQQWPTNSTKYVNIQAIGEVDSFQMDETTLKRKLFSFIGGCHYKRVQAYKPLQTIITSCNYRVGSRRSGSIL